MPQSRRALHWSAHGVSEFATVNERGQIAQVDAITLALANTHDRDITGVDQRVHIGWGATKPFCGLLNRQEA
jgi:hypothetical protein